MKSFKMDVIDLMSSGTKTITSTFIVVLWMHSQIENRWQLLEDRKHHFYSAHFSRNRARLLQWVVFLDA